MEWKITFNTLVTFLEVTIFIMHMRKCEMGATQMLSNTIYYMPSTFYNVKLPLALGNSFHRTESILAQSLVDSKYPYWGINMDFWHCLIVMTYRNRALFRFFSFQHG